MRIASTELTGQRKLDSMGLDLIEERLTYSIIGAGYDVYRELGFGFREHVYKMALERVLLGKGHRVGREVRVPVFFRGVELTTDRMDILVDEKIVVEVKASRDLPSDSVPQLLSYLKGTNLEVGLLLHFGPKRLGRHRLVASNEFKLRRL